MGALLGIKCYSFVVLVLVVAWMRTANRLHVLVLLRDTDY